MEDVVEVGGPVDLATSRALTLGAEQMKGRPSKLTDDQWSAVEADLLTMGYGKVAAKYAHLGATKEMICRHAQKFLPGRKPMPGGFVGFIDWPKWEHVITDTSKTAAQAEKITGVKAATIRAQRSDKGIRVQKWARGPNKGGRPKRDVTAGDWERKMLAYPGCFEDRYRKPATPENVRQEARRLFV